MGTCSGDYAEYDLNVNTGEDPALTLVNDDVNTYSTTITSQGTVHLP
jgi:hypothetical protein